MHVMLQYYTLKKKRDNQIFFFVENTIYTAWGSWQSCETCGLTNRRKRSRECVDPGISYTAMGACDWSLKNELEHCYRRCGGLYCYAECNTGQCSVFLSTIKLILQLNTHVNFTASFTIF